MKKLYTLATFCLFITFSTHLHAHYCARWGATGHRVVATIAESYLNKKAKAAVAEILGNETMVFASTWFDDIKSDSKYRKYSPWHYTTVPDGATYDEITTPEQGDVVTAINIFIDDLKNTTKSIEERRFALCGLIHLIGDIHQPLHVGKPGDRGGNSVKVSWMGDDSNLHRVWDSDMIRLNGMSYTELAKNINFTTAQQVNDWQSTSVAAWADESITYREQVYSIGDGNLGYKYKYHNFDTVKLRLLQGGVRLAGVLNQVFS